MNTFESYGGTSAETETEPNADFSLFENIRKECRLIGATETEDSTDGGVFHSKWVKQMEQQLLQVQKYPDEVAELWSEFNSTFIDSSDEEKTYADKFKADVLSHVAAQTLIKGFEKNLTERKIPVSIEIKPSTPKEDLGDKVDFWVRVVFNGKRETREKTFACRVINVDASSGSVETNRSRAAFIKENYLDFSCPEAKRFLGADKKTIEAIREFYEKNPAGIALTLPMRTVRDDGKVNDILQKDFTEHTLGNGKSALWEVFIP